MCCLMKCPFLFREDKKQKQSPPGSSLPSKSYKHSLHTQTRRQKIYVGADVPLRGPCLTILRQRVDYTEDDRHIATVHPSSFDRTVLAKLPAKRRYTRTNVTRLVETSKTQSTRQRNLNYHIARVYMSESMPSMAARNVVLSSTTPAKV